MLRNIAVIAWRELVAYFTSPLAYVFIIVFLMLLGGLTFYFGNFVDRGQADLLVFFQFHPWLYVFLVPAVSMRSTARPVRPMVSMAAPVVRAVTAAMVGPAGPVAPRSTAGPRVRPVAPVWLPVARRAGTAGPAAAVMTPRL